MLCGIWGWGSVEIGSIGIIDGFTEQEYPEDVQITFNYRAFIGSSRGGPEFASVSGGPGTTATPVSELVKIGRTTVNCWRWKDGIPGAGRGISYDRECDLWAWIPKEK
jgi:hypothetical protein